MRHSLIACFVVSCASAPVTENHELVAADDVGAKPNLRMTVSLGATLQTIENANLREAANATSLVLRIVPAGQNVTVTGTDQAQSGFYSVRHNGLSGWMAGAHLKFISAPAALEEESTPDMPPPLSEPEPPAPSGPVASTEPVAPPPAAPDIHQAAMDRAVSGLGYSYWWGGSRWDPSGATASNKGTCSGTCGGDPGCTHTGTWGADCSGYVAKIWQVPASNTDLQVANHSYSTINFANQQTEWTTVQRTDAKMTDAFVYNTNGHGHIFLFESTDAWGKVWAYEAKGCSIGIVHDLRTVDDVYKTIRRNGY